MMTMSQAIKEAFGEIGGALSTGNIHTTETYEGKRLQKFVYKGIGPVRKRDQGPPWPTSH